MNIVSRSPWIVYDFDSNQKVLPLGRLNHIESAAQLAYSHGDGSIITRQEWWISEAEIAEDGSQVFTGSTELPLLIETIVWVEGKTGSGFDSYRSHDLCAEYACQVINLLSDPKNKYTFSCRQEIQYEDSIPCSLLKFVADQKSGDDDDERLAYDHVTQTTSEIHKHLDGVPMPLSKEPILY